MDQVTTEMCELSEGRHRHAPVTQEASLRAGPCVFVCTSVVWLDVYWASV